MYRVLDFIAGVLMLQLPIELEVLVTTLKLQALHVPPVIRVLNNHLVLDALERFSGVYYTACIKYIIVSGAIANSVLRALAKQGSATSITLSSPNCAPVSWGAGVMSILTALSSITLSFWYASNLRQVTLQRDGGLIWIQNAWRNAGSPWKNVSSLLIAPCALCIGSVLLYTIHLLSSGKCGTALGTAPFDNDVDMPLHNSLSPVPTMIQPQAMKAIVAVTVVILWTYTVHAMRAFADLNNPVR